MIFDAAIRAARPWARGLGRLAAGLLVAVVAGCATGPNANPKDPLEPFNRKMFAFNDALDTHLLKPVAISYTKVVPRPVRTGVHNFFGNFADAWSTVNQLLQGKFDNTARMTMRVLTNTFMGLGGVLDPATEMGLEKQPEDLGQTFGRWGVPPGPYLVLPLFGPSDVRDAVALPADDYVSPSLLVNGTGNKLIVDSVGVIDTRANLLGATDLLNDIALDRYTFIRDAYITRRRSLVYDGNPPDEPGSDDDDQAAPAPGAPASGSADGGAAGNGRAPPVPAPGASAPNGAPAPAPGASASGPAAEGAAAANPAISRAAGDATLASTRAAPAPERPHAQEPPMPPSGASSPSPPVPGVSPAPLPASAPTLPVPPSGPVPVPPPPASAPR